MVRIAAADRVGAEYLPQLVNQSFATVIDSTQPIVAERAMYFGETPFWYGGHGTVGVPEAAKISLLPETATGSFFDTFVLLSNPHGVSAEVRVFYGTEDGQVIEKTKSLEAVEPTHHQCRRRGSTAA